LQVSATHVSDADRIQGLEGGADGYLTEPMEAEELLATVKALLRLYQREEENRRLLDQLRDADRRKNEFLATLSHELRNPLYPMRAAVEIMRLKDDLDPDIQFSRDVIDQQVNHLTRLIDDLLDVARITRDKIELRRGKLRLVDVLNGALASSRTVIEAHGRFAGGVGVDRRRHGTIDADLCESAQQRRQVHAQGRKYLAERARRER